MTPLLDFGQQCSTSIIALSPKGARLPCLTAFVHCCGNAVRMNPHARSTSHAREGVVVTDGCCFGDARTVQNIASTFSMITYVVVDVGPLRYIEPFSVRFCTIWVTYAHLSIRRAGGTESIC